MLISTQVSVHVVEVSPVLGGTFLARLLAAMDSTSKTLHATSTSITLSKIYKKSGPSFGSRYGGQALKNSCFALNSHVRWGCLTVYYATSLSRLLFCISALVGQFQ